MFFWEIPFLLVLKVFKIFLKLEFCRKGFNWEEVVLGLF